VITLPVQLVEVAAVTDPGWAHRLTGAERAYCTGLRYAADHVAVRIAAKRAVFAALEVAGEPRWHEVEIRREPGAGPVVVLHGRLRGALIPGVSLTHAAGHAAAIAWLPADQE
jgi:phosphopantetheinyl transferase (holo-ACP synthase)